jgi:hypothetical protein
MRWRRRQGRRRKKGDKRRGRGDPLNNLSNY